MAHISFLSNIFGLFPQDRNTSAILFGRHFMYGDVWLFLFITADRTVVASRLHNYLKTDRTQTGWSCFPSGEKGGGGGGRTRLIFAYMPTLPNTTTISLSPVRVACVKRGRGKGILFPVFTFAFIFHCCSFSPCWPLAFLIFSPPL